MRMDTASTRSGRARRERVTCPVGGGPRAAADAVCHDVGDAVAGLAVAVWAGDFRRRILIRPDEFLMEGLGDLVPICSYQPRYARIHTLGPLCDAAGHQYPLPKRRCLFLNAARIHENSSAVREQVHDVKVGQRIHELHVGESSEEPCNRSTDIGVGMHRRSEEHTSELQSLTNLVCRLLLEKKKKKKKTKK